MGYNKIEALFVKGVFSMNKKAENFKKYLDEKRNQSLYGRWNQRWPVPDGRLPVGCWHQRQPPAPHRHPRYQHLRQIRVLVAPKVLHDDNEAAVLKLLNTYNKQYKSFKYHIDDEGNLILDTCVLLKDDEVGGDLIYAMFDVIIRHLGESYKELMKSIWA